MSNETTAAPARYSSQDFRFSRLDVVPRLIGDHEEFLFVTGLGARDIVAMNNDGPNLYALGGAMGAATTTGLGLALAQPDRNVMVVTGDGELLMNVGALATIGVMAPPNLSILCVDNGHYVETGNQRSLTSRGVDLELVARGGGITTTATVATEADVARGYDVLHNGDATSFVRVLVTTEPAPQIPRDRDGAAARRRFREALLTAGAGS